MNSSFPIAFFACLLAENSPSKAANCPWIAVDEQAAQAGQKEKSPQLHPKILPPRSPRHLAREVPVSARITVSVPMQRIPCSLYMQKYGPNCWGTPKLAISSIFTAPLPKRFPEWIETGTVGVQALKFTARRSFSENRGKIKAVIASRQRATASSRRTALPVPNVREAVVEMISVVRTHFTMDLIR
jgi:hypothetical protein